MSLVALVANSFPFFRGAVRCSNARPGAVSSRSLRSNTCSRPSRTNPIIPPSSWRCSSSGSGRVPSSSCATATAGGPIWSFVDGPVTANRFALGVHTAWGRTLKDVFQRYKALRGFDQRYQNGFDCQGLWIEVGVERELGLNSKREIEEYGLEEFARKCRDVVVRSSAALTRGSKRLGQWMDWGNDYFTFSDTNIEYIWKFLKLVHERGWLVHGPPLDRVVPALRHVALAARADAGRRLPGSRRPVALRALPAARPAGESLVVWTTTPWTLPANVAAAVHPDEEYGRRENGEWVAVKLFPDDTFVERRRGAELVGWRYRGPFDDLPPGSRVEHRVIPWEDVTMDQGTGIVHIAPGCGGEDFELSKVHDLPVLTPVDESGRFYDDYGWLHGLSTTEAADQIIGRLGETRLPGRGGPVHARVSALLALRHAADLPALRRLVHRGRRDQTEAAGGERQGAIGCPSTWASAWTTGSATWATGTSRGAATTGCRCRSIRAAAAT